MRFDGFFRSLEGLPRSSVVSVEALFRIINTSNLTVGTVTRTYFPDFEGAQAGHFIWLDEDRTSPYEDSFRNAVVQVNEKFRHDASWRRLIGAKELMHSFDDDAERTCTKELFIQLVTEISANPMPLDASEPYKADRVAFWKALICLIPPWNREKQLESWQNRQVSISQLAKMWVVPEYIAEAAMTDYYGPAVEHLMNRRV